MPNSVSVPTFEIVDEFSIPIEGLKQRDPSTPLLRKGVPVMTLGELTEKAAMLQQIFEESENNHEVH